MNITEDYVSFEIAKLLKEKGFDWRCNSHYWSQDLDTLRYSDYPQNWNCASDDWYSCPTHQMAMKWLREEHNIFIVIEPHAYDYINEKNSSYVFSIWQGDNYCENPLLKDFPTYEQATEAAIKYCLENLI